MLIPYSYQKAFGFVLGLGRKLLVLFWVWQKALGLVLGLVERNWSFYGVGRKILVLFGLGHIFLPLALFWAIEEDVQRKLPYALTSEWSGNTCCSIL